MKFDPRTQFLSLLQFHLNSSIYNLITLDDLVQPAFLGILLSFCPQWKPTTLCSCSNALFPSSVRTLCYVLFLTEHLLCKTGWKLVLYATSTVSGPLTSCHVSLLLIRISGLGWVCFATFVWMKTHCCHFLLWDRNRMTTNICILDGRVQRNACLTWSCFLGCWYWGFCHLSKFIMRILKFEFSFLYPQAHRFEFYSLQHNRHTYLSSLDFSIKVAS